MIIGDMIILGTFHGEKANIFITGLSSTDTVTATKGNKIRNGVWTTRIIGGVSTNGHLISNLVDLGEYIISASDGTRIKRDIVYVIGANDYIIHMAYLPSGYTELKCIISSGTQYINTGYTMTSDVAEYGIDCIDLLSTIQVDNSLFGSETSTSPKYSGIPYKGLSVVSLYIGSGATVGVNLVDGYSTYIAKISSSTIGTVEYNGLVQNFTYANGLQKSLNIYLFSNNINGSASQISSVKCRKFWIKDNGNLVRNLIPAKNSSDVVGMYDSVTGNFYTNAGSGTFSYVSWQ